MLSPRLLHWTNSARDPSICFHVARIRIPRGHATEWHTHDFSELFWVEQGGATHLINDQAQSIARGEAVFIRPHDRHAFRIDAGAGITFVNLALPTAILRELEARYAWAEAGGWPWQSDAAPQTRLLSADLLPRLPAATARLAARPASRLALDTFLLDLFASFSSVITGLGQPGHTPEATSLPIWLADAITRFAAQNALDGGSGRLAELAGRSPEHVNRTLRRCLGVTSSQLLNRLRADYAGRQLRLTDLAIADIALACGVHHIGYFYKLFRAHFAMTPAEYRRVQRMGMAPPSRVTPG